MAFKNVNNVSGVKLTSLTIGDSILGYVAGFKDSQHEGQRNIRLVLDQDLADLDGRSYKKGDVVIVYTAGNVRYMINDGKIEERLLTKITRIADKVVNGKKSSQFAVEQDSDVTYSDALFSALSDDGAPAAKVSTAAKPAKGFAAKNAAAQAALTEKRAILEREDA